MERSIKVVIFASPLHDSNSILACRQELLNELRSSHEIEFIDSGKLAHADLKNNYIIAFIATGGVEEMFKHFCKYLSRPILLLSDSYHNSLAATMEIATWLSHNGIPHRHFNFPIEPTRKYLEKFENLLSLMFKVQNTLTRLSKMRVGLIGGESSWLISSAIDRAAVSNRFGTEFIDIPISKVEELFKKNSVSQDLMNNFSRLSTCLCGDRNESDLKDALILYSALKDLVNEYSLDALTIRCFDLLSSCNTTSCLALAILNDEGIVSGCEGDIPSLWSMIIASLLCDSVSFMANPSSIEREDRSIDFAHCTAPISIGKKFTLPSHYESRIGIGLSVKLPLQKYTLFKCGGINLDRNYVFEGDVIQNTNVIERCRTQVKFQFKEIEEIDVYLESHLGNHSVLIPGRHKDEIESFFQIIN